MPTEINGSLWAFLLLLSRFTHKLDNLILRRSDTQQLYTELGSIAARSADITEN